MTLPILSLIAGLSWATSFTPSAKGTVGAQFLKLGVGARAVAMGEAYTAVANEASALYWNPAGLARIGRRSATFMHAVYLDTSYFDYAAYAHNFNPYGYAGASVQYFSAGKITETSDATGLDVGDFTPRDLAVTIGYAYTQRHWDILPELDGFSYGVAAKYIESKIIDTASTGAVDVGVLSPAYLGERLRLAATVTNIGGRLKFEAESAALPTALRVGGAYHILNRWLVATDVEFPNHNAPFIALGTEYLYPIQLEWSLSGRLGFNSRTVGDVSGFTGLSFGVGMGYYGWNLQRLTLDYGFLPMGGVGLAHRISVSYNF